MKCDISLQEQLNDLITYKQIIDENSIVTKTNPKGIITYATERFCNISGYSQNELIGKPHNIVRHPEMPNELFKQMWSELKENGKKWHGIIKNKAKDGSEYIVDTTIIPIFDKRGNIVEFVAMRVDLTEFFRQQKLIDKQNKDHLTGLPNRIKFFQDLQSIENPIVALLNIDRFSDFNQLYGFDAGDGLLIEISHKLSRILPREHGLYKFSADYFLILAGDKNIGDFRKSILGIIKKIEKYCLAKNGTVIEMSSGIATTKQKILLRAEEALKKARRMNHDIAVSDDKDEQHKLQNMAVLRLLHHATKNNKVVPFYQGIYCMKTKKIVKYEALMRIIDEDGKIVSPGFFLDVAKNSKYYQIMTASIIKQVLNDFEKRSEGCAINLSIKDIENEETSRFVLDSISRFCEPSRIVLELTESEGVKDVHVVSDFIGKIKKIGAKVSIDDFGSGYSNFAYIVKFNADFLKIDGSLINNIHTDEQLFKTVGAINSFAKSIGLKTIAEFVSSQEISDTVEEIGVDYAQGYHYAEPKAFADL